MRILLTGGTGLIGQALCQYWSTQGHELVVWSRRPQQVPQLCSGARGIAELQEINESNLPDAVVNLAGAPIIDRPWTARRRQLLQDSRISLTRTLVGWMAQQSRRPEVLISGSAVGFYGDGGEQVLDETSMPVQEGFGSSLCESWEQEAKHAQALGVRVVLIRTAPVLSGEGGMLAKMRLPFRLCLGGRLGTGKQWMPWIHMADEVGLIDYLLNRQSFNGPFNACAPQPVRNSDFTRELARALKRPAIFPVPEWALRLSLGDRASLLLDSQRLMPRRALESGYHFRYVDLASALNNIFSA